MTDPSGQTGLSHPLQGRSCVFHIGLGKTGTSTLQKWLEANRVPLREQGIWHDDLPPHGGPDLTARHGWLYYAQLGEEGWLPAPRQQKAYQIHDRQTLEDKVSKFLKRIENALPPRHQGYCYMTSSEHMARSVQPAAMERVHGWFSERFDQVRYLIYFRDQVDWVPSAYDQAVRGGMSVSLDDFIEARGYVDYWGIYQFWARIAGAECVDVRLFDSAWMEADGLIEDFAEAIGADLAGLSPMERQNVGRPRARILENVQRNVPNSGVSHPTGFGQVSGQVWKKVARRLGTSRKLRLTRAQKRRVRQLNEASNETLRKALFPEREKLF